MMQTTLLHRVLLALILGAPLVWLMLTTDGQRRTDLFLLKLKGLPEVDIRFDALSPGLEMADLQGQMPAINFNCATAPEGGEACHANLAGFNSVPAHFLTLFFGEQGLKAVKVRYRRSYHDHLLAVLGRDYGAPAEGAEAGAPRLHLWSAGEGALILPQAAPPKQPAELVWVAGRPTTASVIRGNGL